MVIIRSLSLPVILVIDGFDEIARNGCRVVLAMLSRLLEDPDLTDKLLTSGRESVALEIKGAFKR